LADLNLLVVQLFPQKAIIFALASVSGVELVFQLLLNDLNLVESFCHLNAFLRHFGQLLIFFLEFLVELFDEESELFHILWLYLVATLVYEFLSRLILFNYPIFGLYLILELINFPLVFGLHLLHLLSVRVLEGEFTLKNGLLDLFSLSI
jgi:hypothetical protein